MAPCTSEHVRCDAHRAPGIPRAAPQALIRRAKALEQLGQHKAALADIQRANRLDTANDDSRVGGVALLCPPAVPVDGPAVAPCRPLMAGLGRVACAAGFFLDSKRRGSTQSKSGAHVQSREAACRGC